MSNPEFIDRITFTDGGDRKEDFKGVDGVLESLSNKTKIKIDPAIHPNNNIEGWIVVASFNGEVKYSGEVVRYDYKSGQYTHWFNIRCVP